MPKIQYLYKTRWVIPSIYPQKLGVILQNMNFSRYYRNRGKYIYGFDPNIIYIAALAGVSPELQEAAIVDGANRFQRIIHVDLPAIVPTIITMLIFNCASIMNIGFDKVYLMQNDMNIDRAEVISTFVYKVGLTRGDFSFSTAAGLFQSLVSFILLVIVNKICKTVTETSLW